MEQQAVPCSCRAAGGPSSQDGVGSAVEEEEAVANLMAAGQKMKCGASQDDGKEDEEEQICSNLNVRKRRVIVPFTGVCAHNTCWLYISAVCLMAPVRASDDTETSANTKQPMGDISNGQGLVPTGFNYTKYVEAQLRKTDTIALAGQTGQWVVDETIQFIARYVTEHLPMSRRFALCHGARSGREALWFRKRLPGMQVWGTELSPVAAAQAPWTVPWDYHVTQSVLSGVAQWTLCTATHWITRSTLPSPFPVGWRSLHLVAQSWFTGQGATQKQQVSTKIQTYFRQVV